MARLAYARAFANDHADFGCGRGVAAVGVGVWFRTLFSATDCVLADLRDYAADSVAVFSEIFLAWAHAGGLRRTDDFNAGVRYRPARELLHIAVPVSDHRGQRVVFASVGVYYCSGVPFAAGRHDRVDVRREDSAHLGGLAYGRKSTHRISASP